MRADHVVDNIHSHQVLVRQREFTPSLPLAALVRQELRDTDEFGIWAGLDQQQQRAPRKKQQRREAATRITAEQPHGTQGAA
jgi:hypothetical protein